MRATIALLLIAVAVSAAPVTIHSESLGDDARIVRRRAAATTGFFKSLLKGVAKVASIFLPGAVSGVVNAVAGAVTAPPGTPLASRLTGAAASVASSGLLPSSVSNIVGAAGNAVGTFASGTGPVLNRAIGAAQSVVSSGVLPPRIGNTVGAVVNVGSNLAMGNLAGAASAAGMFLSMSNNSNLMNIGNVLNQGSMVLGQLGGGTGGTAAGGTTTGGTTTGGTTTGGTTTGGTTTGGTTTGGTTTGGTTTGGTTTGGTTTGGTTTGGTTTGGTTTGGQMTAVAMNMVNPANAMVWTGNLFDAMQQMAGNTVVDVMGGMGNAQSGWTVAGRFGHIKIKGDGSWEYDVDERAPVVIMLGAQANRLTDTFKARVMGPASVQGGNTLTIKIWEHWRP